MVHEVTIRTSYDHFDGTLSKMRMNSSLRGMALLTELEEYVEYNISVRAYTSVGPGPYSEEVTERTDEDGKKLCF